MTGFTVPDPEFRRRCRDSFASQTFLAALGVEMATLEPGFCQLELPSRGDLCQQDGYIHAGVTTTLADTAGGYAAFSLMPAGSAVLTTELKINLVSPAKGDRLIARAEVLKPGRTLSVVRADVFGVTDSGEKLVATMLATMICLTP